MKSLICPISNQKIDRHVVRLTGFMMATMIGLYLLTGNVLFIAIISVDYFIRAFTSLPASPFSWTAVQFVRGLGLKPKLIDKEPKIFAARVGWLFALTATILYFFVPAASVVVALILMSFALLESLLDFCMGCFVYTVAVLPVFRRERDI